MNFYFEFDTLCVTFLYTISAASERNYLAAFSFYTKPELSWVTLHFS